MFCIHGLFSASVFFQTAWGAQTWPRVSRVEQCSGEIRRKDVVLSAVLSLLFVKLLSLRVLPGVQAGDRRKQSLLLLPVHQFQLFRSLGVLQLVVVSVIPNSFREEESSSVPPQRFLL